MSLHPGVHGALHGAAWAHPPWTPPAHNQAAACHRHPYHVSASAAMQRTHADSCLVMGDVSRREEPPSALAGLYGARGLWIRGVGCTGLVWRIIDPFSW